MRLSDNHEIGRAAEYLVAADMILQGIPATPIHGSWPYDVLAEVDGTTVRVQVKSTSRARSWPKAKNVYRFNLRVGKGARRRADHTGIDLIALVALDLRKVAYFKVEALLTKAGALRQCVDLRDEGTYAGRVYPNGRVRTLNWHQMFNNRESVREALAWSKGVADGNQ